MKVLVTAGNTDVPIDQVRRIGNIFKGRTGNTIAVQMKQAGHEVTLLTSSPHPHDVFPEDYVRDSFGKGSITIKPFKTFDELLQKMEFEIVANGTYDLIVHSAAVSDYRPTGTVYIPCDPDEALSIPEGYILLKPVKAEGKIPSSFAQLFIETVQTEKLVDKIRKDWGFKGFLVKFKLEVDKTDGQLIDIARASREHSDADLMVANCLKWAKERAYVIGRDEAAHAVRREDIASAILRRMQ